MDLTGILIFAILIVLINELREWRTAQKFKQLDSLIDDHSQEINDSLSFAGKQMGKLNEQLKILIKEQADSAAFISKKLAESDKQIQAIIEYEENLRGVIVAAQTDLATIVNEYKLNGVPLGYIRKSVDNDAYDSVEGL